MFKIFTISILFTIITLAVGPVLQTEQIVSYDENGDIILDGSVKDDGYYRAGKVRSYSRSGDVVTDNVTGLEWQDNKLIRKKLVTQANYDAGNYNDTSGDTAVTYCSELALDDGGWRLPSIEELETIVANGQYSPALTEGVFHYSISVNYWSSTMSLNRTCCAWNVGFDIGSSHENSFKTNSYFVRCVRGEELEPSNLSRDVEIVTDSTTSLQWQDNEIVKTTRRFWQEAIDYCENNLTLGGHSDWRLPNIKELLSITDRSQRDPSMDTGNNGFQNFAILYHSIPADYWSSSTTHDYNTSSAWNMRSSIGTLSYYKEKMWNMHYVRCVRGGQLNIYPPPPKIEESGNPDAVYKFSVTLEEPLKEGQYIAINFDDQHGGWFDQDDPGGHIVLDQIDGLIHWKNTSLNKPGLRSFRAGIFDVNNTLTRSYSEHSTCTLDRCLLDVIQESDYGNPQLSGSGSQLLRGVDVANGNFHHASTDLSVPGKGPDFTLIRAYNSNADRWSFNLDANATFSDPHDRQIAIGPREDGRMQYFFKDMDQKWYALSPGNFDQLIEESDGNLTLYTKGNLYYNFASPLSSSSGRLQSIHDRDNNALTFAHSSNRITDATDASGRSYAVNRDANGRITDVADFTGRGVAYTWDADDMMTSYENLRTETMQYSYDGTKLTGIKDQKGNTQYTIIYEDTNNTQSVTDSAGNIWSYLYYPDLHKTGIERPETDGVNNNIIFVFDDSNKRIIERVDYVNAGEAKSKMKYKSAINRQQIAELSLKTQTERPSGAKTDITFEDDATGNPSLITNALSQETNATWSAVSGQKNLTPLESLKQPGVTQSTQYKNFTPSGKAQQIINSLGDSSFLTYNSTGLMTHSVDARSNVTNITYDAQGRPTHITDAKSQVSETIYNALGRVTKKINPRLYYTSYTYDANGNVETITDAKGGVTTYTYDVNDNVVSIKNARDHTTTFTYDTFNRKIQESYSVGGDTYLRKFEYDALNRVHRVINESNHASQKKFDPRGKVKEDTNPLSQSTVYTYDENGNVKTITDAEDRLITYIYDVLDRKTMMIDSLGLYERYIYNEQGLLEWKYNKKGRWTYYGYDALGQMTIVVDPDGEYSEAAYDANGNISLTRDRKGQSVIYIYDELNRMTQLKDNLNRTWNFSYDANGNVLTRMLPSGEITSYTYDELDRVTKVVYHDGQTVDYTYDANGNRLTMVDAQGTTNYSYDELNRLSSVTDSFGNSVGYTYHPTGMIKELTYPGSKKVTYAYDAADRLESLTDWLGDTTNYTKDNSGLTTAVTYGNGADVSKTYDVAGRMISLINQKGATMISSHQLTLDGIGNPISIAADLPLLPVNLGRATEMLYDSSNRLTSLGGKNITHDSDGRITDDLTRIDPIEYAYNAQDLITTIKKNAVTTDSYIYDGDGHRIARTTDGQVNRYVLDPTGGDLYSMLAETDINNVVQHYYIYGEGLISQVSGSNHHYYHFDQSGNTLVLTDDSGTITDKYAYEPFGSTTVEGTSHNPFKFVGQYGVIDDGNGLHHMRARYYSTDMRRFMSLDALYGKVTDPMSLNRYQYVSGNPMVGVDPSGYSVKKSFFEKLWEGFADVYIGMVWNPKSKDSISSTLKITAKEIPKLSPKMDKVLDDAIKNSNSIFVKGVLYYAKGVKIVSDNYTLNRYEAIVDKCVTQYDNNENITVRKLKACIGSFKDLASPEFSIDTDYGTFGLDTEGTVSYDKSDSSSIGKISVGKDGTSIDVKDNFFDIKSPLPIAY